MPTAEKRPALLTIEETCQLLRISRETCYRMCRDGRLLAVPIGNGPNPRLRVVSGSVASFLRAQAEARLGLEERKQ